MKKSIRVALLAEGVDRNRMTNSYSFGYAVALLAEGVDRNLDKATELERDNRVALLAEGVDRNLLRHVIAVSVLVALQAVGGDIKRKKQFVSQTKSE